MRRLVFLIKSLSLIEVCMAIAILAIILGSMVNLFGQGFMAFKKTKDKVIACNLLRGEMENKSVNHGSWPPVDMALANVTGFNMTLANGTVINEFKKQVNCTGSYAGYSRLTLVNTTVWWECNVTGCNKNKSMAMLKADY